MLSQLTTPKYLYLSKEESDLKQSTEKNMLKYLLKQYDDFWYSHSQTQFFLNWPFLVSYILLST